MIFAFDMLLRWFGEKGGKQFPVISLNKIEEEVKWKIELRYSAINFPADI